MPRRLNSADLLHGHRDDPVPGEERPPPRDGVGCPGRRDEVDEVEVVVGRDRIDRPPQRVDPPGGRQSISVRRPTLSASSKNSVAWLRKTSSSQIIPRPDVWPA